MRYNENQAKLRRKKYMNKLQLKRYAKLLAKTGIKVKRGQWVIANAGHDTPT